MSNDQPARDVVAIDFDTLSTEVYEQVCKELLREEARDVEYYRAHPERHPGNHPSDYETLREAEKHALRYWIDHAITGGRRYAQRSSYGIKHDFEKEGFYITNGQFKGAMLLAGYMPKNIHDVNWVFPIRQRMRTRDARSEDYTLRERYTIGRFDKQYARILLQTENVS